MKKFLILLLIPIAFASCSKNLVPFTEKMEKEYNFTPDDIKSIQFYTSGDIILQRKVSEGQKEIVSGTIKLVDGKEVEEVIIRKGTKGIATMFPSSSKIAVSFEISDDHSLTFGINPNRGDRYYLLAKEWKNRVGKVNYNGEEFSTSPRSSDAYLLVNIKALKDWDVSQRVAKGRDIK